MDAKPRYPRPRLHTTLRSDCYEYEYIPTKYHTQLVIKRGVKSALLNVAVAKAESQDGRSIITPSAIASPLSAPMSS